jgi:hypothetical protein
MQAPLPLHRRARTWYGSRIAPTEPLRHASAAGAKPATVPALRIAALAFPLPQAPVDRRLAAVL